MASICVCVFVFVFTFVSVFVFVLGMCTTFSWCQIKRAGLQIKLDWGWPIFWLIMHTQPPVEREEDVCAEKKFNPIKHDKQSATAASEVIFMPLSCPSMHTHYTSTGPRRTSNPPVGPRRT